MGYKKVGNINIKKLLKHCENLIFGKQMTLTLHNGNGFANTTNFWRFYNLDLLRTAVDKSQT